MKCRDCGEPIQFLEGDRRPYDLTPRVHYANKIHQAAIRGKNGKPIAASAKKAVQSESYRDAKLGLEALRYKPTEADELLRDVPEGEPADMVRAALKKKGEE